MALAALAAAVPRSWAATSCDAYGSSATYSEAISGTARVITSNGCPNHYSLCTGKSGVPGCGDIGEAGTATEAKEASKEISVMHTPVIAASTTNVECTMGAIGIALNGVSIYSGAVNQNCDKVDVDDSTSEWTAFDFCSGHSERTGDYHYHFPPSCLLAAIGDLSDGHSPQVGWSYDGFPVYGPKGPGGVDMTLCTNSGANSTYCLDSCSGMEMELSGVDEFKYRYYFTGATSDLSTLPTDPKPAATDYPFAFACYKGCTHEAFTAGTCTNASAGTTSSYVAAPNAGYTTQYTAPDAEENTTNAAPRAVLVLAASVALAALF